LKKKSSKQHVACTFPTVLAKLELQDTPLVLDAYILCIAIIKLA
jgi:hypothetical protein